MPESDDHAGRSCAVDELDGPGSLRSKGYQDDSASGRVLKF